MELDQEIEKLQAEVQELTDAINAELIDEWNERKEEGFIVDVSLLILRSSSVKSKLSEIVKKQVKIKQLIHKQCLTCDIDRHFCEIINKARPRPSDVIYKVVAAVKDLAQKIGDQYPQFRCRLRSTGSYQEGTKITELNEMDFIFVIPQCYVDYIVKSWFHEADGEYEITLQRHSYLSDYCDSSGTLHKQLFLEHFKLVLGEVLQEVCNEKQLDFNGFDSPHFSGLRPNGPALTVQIEGISIDFTLAFQLPPHLMWKILKQSTQLEVLSYVKKYVPNYDRLGLVVVRGNTLRISMSLLLCFLFRHTQVLRKSLIICKYYDEHILKINSPSLSQYDHYVIRCFEDLCQNGTTNISDVILKYLFGKIEVFQFLDISRNDLWSASDHAMFIFQKLYEKEGASIEFFESLIVNHFLEEGSKPWPTIAVMLHHATKPKPLVGDVDSLSMLHQHLLNIQSKCKEALDGMGVLNLHSSLAEIVGEQIKPAVNTVSHTFKLLILKVFCANTNMSVTECVLSVLQTYQQQLTASMDINITDPLVGRSVKLQKITDWWIKLDVNEIHKDHIVAIVGDLQKLLEVAKRSPVDFPPPVTQYTSSQGSSWKQLQLFWERDVLPSNTDAYVYVDMGDIVGLEYLDNGDIIVLTNEGVFLCNKLGEVISDQLINSVLYGSDKYLDISVNRRLNKLVILKKEISLGCLYIWQQDDSEWHLLDEYKVCENPLHVAMTTSGCFVIVAGESGLYKYSTGKRLIWHNNSFTYLQSMVVDNQDNILISHDKDIWVFNQDGDLILTFVSTYAPLDPRGLCVDDDGCILVCEGSTKSILLFNDQYQFIKKLLTMDHIPCYVTVWRNRYITVSKENAKVYISRENKSNIFLWPLLQDFVDVD